MKQILFVLLLINAAFVFSQNPLLIPPVLYGPEFNLNVQNGTVEFIPGIVTPTYGINGDILGPTLMVNEGDVITVNVTNNLTGTGNSTTMHWHGFHLSAEDDGGPHQIIEQGATWSPSWEVMNDAATLWYHPHGDGKTDLQVARGLAGFFIVRDMEETLLDLPRSYGIDDIPLAIQTKAFDVLNQIAIATEMDTLPMVNATVDPYIELPAQVIRLRLLNGASMRTFYIGFTNDMPFYVIAGDGGLLSEPVEHTRLILPPGERYEILIDLSGMEGQSLMMRSFASEFPDGIYGAANPSGMGMGTIMGYDANPLNGADFDLLQITVGAPTASPVTAIPASLIAPKTIPAYTNTRYFTLEPETMGMDNMVMGPFVINGVSFNMDVINEVVPINTIEKWRITNNTHISHPFHIHEGQFLIDNINGMAPDAVDAAFQDVVFIPPGQFAEVIKTFEDFADDMVPYMYHCHMLHHEDDGMMGSFTVVAQDAVVDPELANCQIYPNPAASGASLILSSTVPMDAWRLYNTLGEMISTAQVTGSTATQIRLPELPAGAYYIAVSVGEYTAMLPLVLQ
ncbi:MAG TPA: multicopper oxidase domain-containing protein [Chitinophagales bacterium]|nr:multicopper oxidase domain-containing protein [Chitinophagales bacterium]